ncbi:hypothetical protein HN031_15665 [Nocardioides sp. zg-1308]|uniref:Integral membrane protein n=1 Tax=Nocardioides renjunii TaxID=3095075 RepID=A0ABU5KB75_9ACTN|nr:MULTISPECIES: hypothetical protein [unclassified Nocardioides]MDZ5662177.1 hypothetical protein [Nocardioides sp. S-58]NPD06117.1 hypothetical protein [Nocardioides sp. zg-1308]WQQ20357.1 hypothetical protein SHK17_10575 [Nocardioides sp. S-34]
MVGQPQATGATSTHRETRRHASHVYGLIIGGAVLATVPEDFRLVRVALNLFITLVVYWAAETYVHWISVRTLAGRALTSAEKREVVGDGWPLVAACAVPVAFLVVEALFRVETALAVDLALGLNAVLLLVVGWRMGRAGHLRGGALVVATVAAGLLGVAMIVLKIALH